MFWPFKRKPSPAESQEPAPSGAGGARSAEEDAYDRAARNLIAQGVPPHKVERATRLIKRYAQEGVLPEGIVKTDE